MNSTNIGYIISETPTVSVDFKILAQNGDRVMAEGILQEGEEKNRNGRSYATKDLASEITAPRQQELIKTGNFKGEAGHPTDKDIARQQTVLPTLEQVLFLKLWMDGNFVKAHFQGTNNDLGNAFDGDLRMGQKPSFSLRALGMIEQAGGKAWVKNLKIITYDRVYYPSHSKAYTTGLVTESACLNADIREQYALNEQVVSKDYKGMIIPITNESVRNYIMAESANLQTIINNFDSLYESIQVIDKGRNVQLVTANYDTLIVPLENYVQDEIMNYCYKK